MNETVKLARNADVKSQIQDELGETLLPGLSTVLAQKFGAITARIDKNFWRQMKRPTWYTDVDEKGRDTWQQKKSDILAEVNRIIRKQLKDQSRQQGRPSNRPSLKPFQKSRFNQTPRPEPRQEPEKRPTHRPFHDSLRNRTFGSSGGSTSRFDTTG